MKFVSDDPYALVFRVGKLQLRIQKVEDKPRLGYTVLGWVVSDIHKTVRQLSRAGVKFEQYDGLGQDADGIWRAPGGAQVAWFLDPDTNILSLTEYPR